MIPIRVVAISTEIAEAVRATMRAPVYGHPAFVDLATERIPCRHCLRILAAGVEQRILFTYDRFTGVESLPLPGPVYIHAESCARYPENGGFPREMRASPRTLEAYARGRRLLAQEHVANGKMEEIIEQFFTHTFADYILVNSTTAGCFTFRIERQDPRTGC